MPFHCLAVLAPHQDFVKSAYEMVCLALMIAKDLRCLARPSRAGQWCSAGSAWASLPMARNHRTAVRMIASDAATRPARSSAPMIWAVQLGSQGFLKLLGLWRA